MRAGLHFLVVGAAALGAFLPAGGAGAEEGMFEPRFREGRGGDVLVAGTPALLRGQVDAFVDLFEAAFDLAFAAPDEQVLRDAVEGRFAAWPAGERESFLELVAPITALREKGRRGDVEGMKAGQRAFWIALDRRIQAAPREAPQRLLVEALEKRQRTTWRGVPAIHAVAADAWLELNAFLVGVGRNETFEPTAGQRTTLVEELDRALHPQPEAVRERVRQAHRVWLLVKARWDAASQTQRYALRWQVVRLLARILGPARLAEPAVGPTPADYARAAHDVASRLSPYDAWSNLARQPAATLEALLKGLDVVEPLPEHALLYR
jgi:hypothetical protein